MTDLLYDLLPEGELTLVGRIGTASNQTFLCDLTAAERSARAVYKPVAGERPLWDFPDGTLALREYAAWLVSESLGWRIVPPTTLRDGPAGPGMVQLWQEPDVAQDPIDIVAEGRVPTGFLSVLDAVDQQDRPVTLIHEDTPELRRMAVFDVIVNNTDRKGGHVLPQPGGHRYGVDHGVCFHQDDKLRTVLWGWGGERLDDEETAGVRGVMEGLDGDLGDELHELLSEVEVEATRQRCARLLRAGRFPEPEGGWPSIPWPPF